MKVRAKLLVPAWERFRADTKQMVQLAQIAQQQRAADSIIVGEETMRQAMEKVRLPEQEIIVILTPGELTQGVAELHLPQPHVVPESKRLLLYIPGYGAYGVMKVNQNALEQIRYGRIPGSNMEKVAWCGPHEQDRFYSMITVRLYDEPSSDQQFEVMLANTAAQQEDPLEWL